MILPAILISAGFLIAGLVLAYDSRNAHRALTYEAAEFYNLNFDNKLGAEEMGWLMDGAQAEDTPPRWINHFYNPITGEGWKGEGMGDVPSDTLKLISRLALSSRAPISAKNWAKNRSAQSDYASYGGDQTWQRAIEAYIAGDEKAAFEALGHILHLLEDMTVPDHTRGDTHAGLAGDKGSPYENWAKNYTAGKEKTLGIASALYKAGQKPKQFPIVENYFDWNANYSSKNFFSEDTITGECPKLSRIENVYINNLPAKKLYTDDGNGNYLVALIILDAKNNITKTISDNEILNNYWQRLSKQAVISGAGAINLFFQDVENQKKINPNPEPRQITSNTKIFSPFGALVQAYNAVNNFVLGAKTIATDILPSPATTIDINNLLPPAPLNSALDPGSVSGMTEGDNFAQPPATPSAPNSPSPPVMNSVKPPASEPQLYISRVIDGDTVTLNNGKDVRLIGINSPEYGEKCFEEAKQNLETLILGKYITLQKDTSETDKYNRLLRYIYLDGAMINAEMVKQGFANIMTIPPDTKYADAFRALEDEAIFFHHGCLYKKSLPTSLLQRKEASAVALADDRGPYYGGSSYAGGSEQPNQNTVGTPAPNNEATSTPETLSIIAPTSTPENSATSAPDIPPIIAPTSTPETATSTPPAPEPEPEPAPAQDKILISEVQVKGASADDEFVELYNPNNSAVSLKGWSLQYRGSGSKNFSKKNFENSAEIPAYGFYLIAHKNYSGGTMPDMSQSTIALSASGGTIFLVKDKKYLEAGDESIISDKVAYLAEEKSSSTTLFPETMEISATSTFASFERKSNASSTAASMTKNGINETDGNAYDTENNLRDFIFRDAPQPQNASSTPEDPTNQHYPPEPEPEPAPEPEPPPPPEPEIVCETFSYETHDNTKGQADNSNPNIKRLPPINKGVVTTLPANTTYYVDYWDKGYVEPGAKLIIEEGVVLKFGRWRIDTWYDWPSSLRVAGSLEINGTKNNPVIFTTFRDDAHGIPINMSTSTPAPGDWGALQIESGKNETIKIQNAKFYYGGGDRGNNNGSGGAIFINSSDADIDISDVEVSQSISGIYSRAKSSNQPEIVNSIFEKNKFWGVSLAKNSAIKLIGNTIKCNGLLRENSAGGGIIIQDNAEKMIIENNNFLANATVGLNYVPDKNENLTAINNYWGHSSGPFHAAANPGGKGNSVSNNVIFSPWSPSAFGNSD